MTALAGSRPLLSLALRRERVRIPVYLALFVLLVLETAAGSKTTYTTHAARVSYAATVEGNPGLIAMVGPPYNLLNVGGDVAWQMGGFGGADERIPGALWLSAEKVARDALAAVERGDRVTVPGPHNRIAALWGQHLPRSILLPLVKSVWPVS